MRKLFPITVCALAVVAVWLADADRRTDGMGIVAGLNRGVGRRV